MEWWGVVAEAGLGRISNMPHPSTRPYRSALIRGTYQSEVSTWLCSQAMSYLTRRHMAGLDPLTDSTEDLEHVVEFLVELAEREFADDWDEDRFGRSSKFRLDRALLLETMNERATWVLSRWSRTLVDSWIKGAHSGKHTGTRKGRVPRWSYGDLAPFWNLPERKRAKACMSETGMSSSTYYRLAGGMDDFMKRRADREAERVVQDAELIQLMTPEVSLLDSIPADFPCWTGNRVWARLRRISEYEHNADDRPGLAGDSLPAEAASAGQGAGGSPERVATGQGAERRSGGAGHADRGTGSGDRPAELAGRGTAARSTVLHRGAGHTRTSDDLRRHPELPHRPGPSGEDGRGGVRRPHDDGQRSDRDPSDGRSGRRPGGGDRVPVAAGGDADGARSP